MNPDQNLEQTIEAFLATYNSALTQKLYRREIKRLSDWFNKRDQNGSILEISGDQMKEYIDFLMSNYKVDSVHTFLYRLISWLRYTKCEDAAEETKKAVKGEASKSEKLKFEFEDRLFSAYDEEIVKQLTSLEGRKSYLGSMGDLRNWASEHNTNVLNLTESELKTYLEALDSANSFKYIRNMTWIKEWLQITHQTELTPILAEHIAHHQ